jgi:hypothetical protein
MSGTIPNTPARILPSDDSPRLPLSVAVPLIVGLALALWVLIGLAIRALL